MSQITKSEWLFLSEILTGFNSADLQGTGLVGSYLDIINQRLKKRDARDLRKLVAALEKESNRDDLLQAAFASSLGATLRNVIGLWYMGSWVTIKSGQPSSEIVSGSAYREGLMWRAIGAHPMGAKQTGFGSWAEPPESFQDTNR